MGLVICHTADWHLGRSLHGASFDGAHRRFLAWLVDRIVEHAVDVLVVAGDVFDRSVPPASAEATFYGFLAQLAQAAPRVQVLVVAGNHDGPARLCAPAPLLARLGAGRLDVHLVGRLPVAAHGALDLDAMVIPLRTRAGDCGGHAIAVPFLRPSDLAYLGDDGSGAVARTRALHRRAIEVVRRRENPGVVLAVGHGHVRGARLSPDSERPLLGGEDAAVPVDVFPPALSYVALGHLHLAQSLDGGRVRYAGAPLPLAFSERSHPHQIVIVHADGTAAHGIEPVRVPPFVELVRVESEAGEPLPVATALERLEALEGPSDRDGHAERWVQVRLRLDAPRAALKRELAEALLRGGSGARLVSVEVERSADGGLGPTSASACAEIAPEAVLERVWRSVSPEPVPAALNAALREAWEEARTEHEEELAHLPDLEEDLVLRAGERMVAS